MGKVFSIGKVRCEGIRLCLPCQHLDRLWDFPVTSNLRDRGGLRAYILQGDRLYVSDAIAELNTQSNEIS